MKLETIRRGGVTIAVVTEGAGITDVDSAMELAMTARYETGADRIAMDKRLVCEAFFLLSTRLAGEILQKLINYHFKIWRFMAITPIIPANRCGILSMNPIRETTSFA